MSKINLYPKIAKWGLGLMFGLTAVSIVAIFFMSKFDFGDVNVKRIAAFTVFIFAFPLLCTFQFFIDPIEKLAKENNVKEDRTLKSEIEGLLKSVEGEVIVGVYDSEEINAFAISSLFGKKSLIAFSSSFVSCANESQFLAIAAHEVAHVINGDSKNKIYILAFNHAVRSYPYILSSYFKAIAASTFFIVLMALFVLLGIVLYFQSPSFGLQMLLNVLFPLWKIFAIPVAIVLMYAILNYTLDRLFFAYSREREFVADRDGALMTSVEDMLSGLDLLSVNENAIQKITVFDTHPPLLERKERLLSVMA